MGAVALLHSALFAQSMNENFDAYTAGSYMGLNSSDWTTWSGAVGGAEDVQVSSTESFSGSNSIYFVSSSSGGGPQDVIVPFGGEYNTGQFYFEAKFFVVTNKGAYFNFQGNNTVGQIWSLNCQMVQTGQMYIDDSYGNSIVTTYPPATWFTLAIDINLNTNEWEILVDGVSQGVMQNTYNQVASIDLFPVNSANGGNNQSGFYVDDFQFNHTPYVLPAVNGAVTAIENTTGIVGIDIQPTVVVRNLGTNNITSFDLTLDYNGNQIVENVTGVNIPSLDTYDVDFSSALTLVSGAIDITATISNVNGAGADGDAADDVKVLTIDPVTPAVGKVVVAEEGTGTWCQWCPRGAVFMDMMTHKYEGFFAPVAVHNGDPMTNDEYDSDIGALIGGYPSALVDRMPEIDPSAIEADFMERIVIAPKAVMSATATYNSTTSLMDITVTADFVQNTTGSYKLGCIVTEDGVTGTGSGWSQSNAYAGGANGEMGGYEALPNPVPASQMVYDHVAREILPSFAGQSGVIPSSVTSGQSFSYTFSFTVEAGWDLSEMNIIPILIAPGGTIDNAGFFTVSDLVSVPENSVSLFAVSVYPNPASEFTSVQISNLQNENVSMMIFDLNGKLIAEKNYGELYGEMILPVNTQEFSSGIYMIQLNIGGTILQEKLVVE